MAVLFSSVPSRVRSGILSGVAAVALVLLLPVIVGDAARADEGQAVTVVEKLHAGLTHLMAEGEAMGQDAAIAYTGDLVDQTYNLASLTAQSIGPSAFRGFDNRGKGLVVSAYRDFAIANYVSRFAKKLPITFDTKNAEAGPRGSFLVHTLLNRRTGDPVELSYVVVTNEAGVSGIADVLYDGVSEAARRRSELSQLARQGAEPLAAALTRKAKQILAGDV